MGKTYDVRFWQTKVYTGKRKNTYRVRWLVDGREYGETFENATLADSYRSSLVAAARSGEAFDTETGLPISMIRRQGKKTWYEFAIEYSDMKWPDSSPMYRRSTAESLTTITVPMLKSGHPLPDQRRLREALRIAFSKRARENHTDSETTRAMNMIARASLEVGDLANPEVLRNVLGRLDLKLDGTRASSNTVRLRRVAFRNALDYAVERKLLDRNPLEEVKTKKRKFGAAQVDPQAVVNHDQARALLDAVRRYGKQGPPLVAFFGCMYYAALRPEEAANLRKENLSLPDSGWGELRLERARPEVGQEWTDSGQSSEEGPLKHREDDVGRPVPCPPPLTALLHEHLARFGTARDGRLFRGARDGGRVGSSVYGRVWAAARQQALPNTTSNSTLAKRPYDLRHAAVSTWLAAGVPPTKVAEWAGHSVAVLLRVYAKCIDGGEQADRERVERQLGG